MLPPLRRLHPSHTPRPPLAPWRFMSQNLKQRLAQQEESWRRQLEDAEDGVRRLKLFLKDQEKKAEQKKRDDKQSQQLRQVVTAQGALEDAVLRKKLVRTSLHPLRARLTLERSQVCTQDHTIW